MTGKASGKTASLSAYLNWFEDATGINDSDPKEWHELRERIADLEAELASERTLAETAWRANADLVSANEKAEAEVERLRTENKKNVERVIYYAKKAGLYSEGGGRDSGAEQAKGAPNSPSLIRAAAEPAASSLSARKATRKTGVIE